ncbi:hypothetical protein R3X27_07420 [Tropicimonas sp. TH_r6]|uniref:hypothetical protein n=1 Tax=Tropicimonas sp. TH_r6 TaxID=3082085 RepID=UPI0029546FBE|nr:hypothetical protein [Tropicimonas sp. TH_r6]MDV7142510.1 hypothetical protein [Tropicimonas sp. TH_r6]
MQFSKAVFSRRRSHLKIIQEAPDRSSLGTAPQPKKGTTMTRTAVFAGLVAVIAMPAFASQEQLARNAGVEPGLYSNAQLTQLVSLQREDGNRQLISRILANPQGAPLVSRLSTSTHGPDDN